MSNENDIHEIQVSIEHARGIVALGDAVFRLIRNKDFKEVVDQAYTTDEARRLTLLLADPNMEPHKAKIMASLQAIGEFHMFLRKTLAEAEQMRQGIKDAEETLAQIESGEEDEQVTE